MNTVRQAQAPPSFEELAERGDGPVPVAHARAVGLTHRQIAWRRARGRFRRARRGAIRIAGAPTSWRHQVRIATLAAGGRVAVSHGSAVRLYGLEMPPSVHERWRHDDAFLEVSTPEPRHVRQVGVRGHRSGTWEEGDLRWCDGMLVTSPLRTLIDLSSRLGVDGTGRLLDDLLRRQLVTMAALRQRLIRLRPAPGRSVRVLRIVVGARADAVHAGESTLESRIRRVIRRAGFRSPTSRHSVQHGELSVRVDIAVPEVTVSLEGDGSGPVGRRRISITTCESETACSGARGSASTSRRR